MYCKDCKFRVPLGNKTYPNLHQCISPKLTEDYGVYDKKGDMLIYPYIEGGWFEVGEKFGCVHFKKSRKTFSNRT
jgi:hypothetical protein